MNALIRLPVLMVLLAMVQGYAVRTILGGSDPLPYIYGLLATLTITPAMVVLSAHRLIVGSERFARLQGIRAHPVSIPVDRQ